MNRLVNLLISVCWLAGQALALLPVYGVIYGL